MLTKGPPIYSTCMPSSGYDFLISSTLKTSKDDNDNNNNRNSKMIYAHHDFQYITLNILRFDEIIVTYLILKNII